MSKAPKENRKALRPSLTRVKNKAYYKIQIPKLFVQMFEQDGKKITDYGFSYDFTITPPRIIYTILDKSTNPKS
jgi:hypothetical protein